MKDKHLHQRRKGLNKKNYTKGLNYKGYTEDGFYFKATSSMWCWKQESKGIIHEEKTIAALKKIKDEEFIGQGKYDHSKTHDYQEFETKSEFLNTEEFGKISGVGSKNNVSMLLKRATTPIKEYDKRAEPRKKRGLHFINCLRNSNIEYLHISPKNIYKNIKQKNHLILKQKIWIFKGVTDVKIQKFKELWKTK